MAARHPCERRRKRDAVGAGDPRFLPAGKLARPASDRVSPRPRCRRVPRPFPRAVRARLHRRRRPLRRVFARGQSRRRAARGHRLARRAHRPGVRSFMASRAAARARGRGVGAVSRPRHHCRHRALRRDLHRHSPGDHRGFAWSGRCGRRFLAGRETCSAAVCRSLAARPSPAMLPDDELWARFAHRFTIYVYVDDACDAEVTLRAVDRIVEVNKPAHTVHRVGGGVSGRAGGHVRAGSGSTWCSVPRRRGSCRSATAAAKSRAAERKSAARAASSAWTPCWEHGVHNTCAGSTWSLAERCDEQRRR